MKNSSRIMGLHYTFIVWVYLLLIAIGLSAVAIARSYLIGLGVMKIDSLLPWNMSIAVYSFFAMSSVGLCMLCAFAQVFGYTVWKDTENKRVVKTASFMGIITLLTGLSSVVLHMGRPDHAILLAFPPYNIGSPMFWIGGIYTSYLFCMFMMFWFFVKEELVLMLKAKVRSESLKVVKVVNYFVTRFAEITPENSDRAATFFSICSLILGVLALVTLGSEYAHLDTRLLWYGPYYPVLVGIMSLPMGAAWLSLLLICENLATKHKFSPEILSSLNDLKKILMVMLATCLIFVAVRLSIKQGNPEALPVLSLIMKGPFSFNFWVLEVFTGLFLPLVFFSYPKLTDYPKVYAICSVFVLTGMFVSGVTKIAAGQVYPIGVFPDSFFPTIDEVLQFSGQLAFVFLVFTLVIKFCPLLSCNSSVAADLAQHSQKDSLLPHE